MGISKGDDMSDKLRLIAETDLDGRVICVWGQGPRDRVARPVRGHEMPEVHSGNASFHGASGEEIAGWLKSRHIRARDALGG